MRRSTSPREGRSADAVLDLVDALVSKSLVLVEAGHREMRYRLLETVRHFAASRAAAAGESEEAARRHAEYFLAGATAREESIYDVGNDPSQLAWFGTEIRELRAAANWFGSERPHARTLGLSHSEPHFTDGLGRLAFVQDEQAAAPAYFTRTLEIDVDDPWSQSLAVQGGACIALMNGRPARAAEPLGTAEVARLRIGIPPRLEEIQFLEALRGLAVANLTDGAYEPAHQRGARLTLNEAVDFARQEPSRLPTGARSLVMVERLYRNRRVGTNYRSIVNRVISPGRPSAPAAAGSSARRGSG